MLIKKMFRDMKEKKTQFISIFIMAILGVFIYSGMNAEWYGMKKEVDKYYKDSNLSEYWVVSDNISKEDENKIKNIDGIKEVARRLTYDSLIEIDNNPTLRINVVENNIISKPNVIEGDKFDINKDGIWLDKSFSKANKLAVGSKIKFDVNGLKLEKIILGLIIHPEYIYSVKDSSEMLPNPKTFGFAYISNKALSLGFDIPYNQLLVKRGDTNNNVKSKIEESFSEKYNIVIGRDMHPSVSMFENEIEQNKALGGVFPIVFFMIAALSMLTTMTRLTNNQRTQIGILKALGFSKTKILFHYISYGIWIGLIGGIIGLLTGPIVIPMILFDMQKTMYTLPNWSIAISPESICIVVISTLCCGIASLFSCRQHMKEVPASTLRPKVPKIGKHTKVEKSKVWRKLSFSIQWNIRDMLRSPIRSLMAVIGVMGCITLLIFGQGLKDSITGVTSWMYGDLNVYETKINLDKSISDKELENIKAKYKGQWIQESSVQLRKSNKNESCSLIIADNDNMINFENEKREKISIPTEGLGISAKMAEVIGVKIGDEIEWRMIGSKSWIKTKITSIFRTPMNQGIVMNKTSFKNTGQIYKDTTLLTSEKISNITKENGIESIQDKNQLIKSFNNLLESIQMIVFILIIAAFVLGSVVLYNLGVLSFTERNRELATLKVLGFFSKQINKILIEQNIWLTIIGIVVGLPCGYILVEFMLSTMSKEMDMMVNIEPISWVISIAATFGLSIIVSLFLGTKVKYVDMVTSLKSVE